jgi:hypothetical protein
VFWCNVGFKQQGQKLLATVIVNYSGCRASRMSFVHHLQTAEKPFQLRLAHHPRITTCFKPDLPLILFFQSIFIATEQQVHFTLNTMKPTILLTSPLVTKSPRLPPFTPLRASRRPNPLCFIVEHRLDGRKTRKTDRRARSAHLSGVRSRGAPAFKNEFFLLG